MGFLAGKQVLHVAACPGSTVTQVRSTSSVNQSGCSTPSRAPGERGHAKERLTIKPAKKFAMLLLATLLASVATTLGEDITVNLSKGKLRGARLDYDFGQYYYAFKGIPYARPPVKELRFKVKTLIVTVNCLFYTVVLSTMNH